MSDWVKDGDFKTLAKSYGKSLIEQGFRNKETGKLMNRSLFYGEKSSAVIFALAKRRSVVAIKQFRYGSGKVQTELPAGNIEKGEDILSAAARELTEETGFKSGRLVQLSPRPLWLDPASFVGFNYPVLALDCEKTGEQKLDSGEYIDRVILVSLTEWISMIESGEIDDATVIAITFLALLYLDKKKLH